MPYQIKRVYAEPGINDGLRILVDRLWPRGLSRADVLIDQWLKECAPSTGLRKWYGHDRDRWPEFKRRYFTELQEHEEILVPIRVSARELRVTLLYAASDVECNNAVALMEYLTTHYI